MKVLFATLDVRLNNLIIEQLGVPSDEVLELEYIEDVEEKAWSGGPQYVFVGDDIESRNNERIEPLLYQTILALHDTFEVVYITDQQKKNSLVRKLLEKGFYRFASKDNPLKTPKTLQQASDAFLKDIDIPIPVLPRNNSLDLPQSIAMSSSMQYVNDSRSIVTAIWSPIPNVGAGTFSRALAVTLAKQGRKVLLIELDWEYSKLARTTALTHTDRNLKNLLRNISRLGEDARIEDFIVNAKMAEDDLPHTHKAAKQKLKKLPSSLFVLCREATAQYEDEPELPDERALDLLFFECKRAGFQHILVDLPSNPNNIYTMLTLLSADEKFAVVDESFSTSGFFKMAMQALESIHLSADSFDLIINKVKPMLTAQDVSEFYDKTPVLALPYCDDMSLQQLELKMEYSEEYMRPLRSFTRRYGIEVKDLQKERKSTGLIFTTKGRL